MPIEKIQLRGISRSPSDRMTAEGGVAESINVHVEDGECVAELQPQDISAEFGAESIRGDILYLHKGTGYRNLIYYDEESHAMHACSSTMGDVLLFALNDGDEFRDVASVGNTLIFATSERMEYVLYKDGEYKDLGSRIPVPSVEFQCRQALTSRLSFNEDHGDFHISDLTIWSDEFASQYDDSDDISSTMLTFFPSSWSNYFEGSGDDDDYNAVAIVEQMAKTQLTLIKQFVKKRGWFMTPIFARYAVRLYDGSYIYQSVPILLGAGNAESYTVVGYGDRNANEDTFKRGWLRIKLQNIYKVTAILSEWEYAGWEDIIESVDVFLSTDIQIPAEPKLTGIKAESLSDEILPHRADGDTNCVEFHTIPTDESECQTAILDEVLSKSQFYTLASFSINQSVSMSRIKNGFDLMADAGDDFVSQDYLVTQETLTDDYGSFESLLCDSLFTYNNTLILSGIHRKLYSGYMYKNARAILSAKGETGVSQVLEFRFHVRKGNKELCVYGRSHNGDHAYGDEYTYTYKNYGSFVHVSSAYAWLAYPDPDCYAVDVVLSEGLASPRGKTYEMQPHPGLNCAYAFLGLDTLLLSSEGTDGLRYFSDWNHVDESEYSSENILWQSESSNPFYFPAEGQIEFNDRLIGLATTTKALSEGQFGQYPLYVFTEGGIWVVPLSSDGSLVQTVPLSREVALSGDSIVPIDQAVVFCTRAGVRLLSGSEITDLSPYMGGRHYVAGEPLASRLSGNSAEASALSAAWNDATPFLDYIDGCSVSYDYQGGRLLFMRSDRPYMYTYMFGANTWHKLAFGGGCPQPKRPLNSYPDCYISAKDADGCVVLLDCSVRFNGTLTQPTMPALIITRPFDLGMPDRYKSITRLFLRGSCLEPHTLKYCLMGSNDNRTWKVLHSLRGPSWRLFRVAVTGSPSSTDRLSYLEVEFTERFSDRIR